VNVKSIVLQHFTAIGELNGWTLALQVESK